MKCEKLTQLLPDAEQITELYIIPEDTRFNTTKSGARIIRLSKRISDFSVFPKMKKLKRLWLGRCCEYDSLDFLPELTKLEFLGITADKLPDLSPLQYLPELTTLKLFSGTTSERKSVIQGGTTGEKLVDLSPLRFVPQLKVLNIYNHSISNGKRLLKKADISPLSALSDLSVLRLYGVVSDYSIIAELKQLERLQIQLGNAEDISFITGLTKLKELDLTGNRIRDISAISSLKGLEKLIISCNPVTDYSPLDNLTECEIKR